MMLGLYRIPDPVAIQLVGNYARGHSLGSEQISMFWIQQDEENNTLLALHDLVL